MSENINFTKSSLEALEPAPPGKRNYYLDSNKKSSILKGFGLVVNDNGSKHFVLTQYFKRDKRTVRLRCGEFPKTTIDQARHTAQDFQSMLQNKVHPTEERAKAHEEQLKTKAEDEYRNISLDRVLSDYLDSRTLKPGTRKDYIKAINETWSDWLEKPLLGITEQVVKDKHKLRSKSSKARANNAMRVMRALFNFARSEYKLPDGTPIFLSNPVNSLSEGRNWNKIHRRKTYIYPTELPDWFSAVESLSNTTARDYFLFLLFTGARRTEAAQLLAKDVDFRAHTFTLRDTKNNEDVTLPMSSFVEKMLSNRLTEDQKWVFSSDVIDGHIIDLRKQQTITKERSGVEFALHDLRRSFITYGESLDISTFAVKRLVNHVSGEQTDVTLGYVGEDIERLRKASQRITDFILSRAKPKNSNVVKIRG
jgi:integrase